MNFGTKTVEDHFLSFTAENFPEKVNYRVKYEAIKQAVEKHLSDATRGGDASDKITLTWHDAGHIQTVIKRATQLLSYDKCELTPYELYYLLSAIQIHDLGNIIGI